ncbi:MAG: hypothetical protein ACYDHC_07870 [Desulfuromonadaceae bacterium]
MGKQTVWFDYVIKNIRQLDSVKDLTLIKGYHQIFEHEQNYGLHPDGFDDPESGWPEELKPICAEMWRRVDHSASAINIENMYYMNKWFRQLASESRRGAGGR